MRMGKGRKVFESTYGHNMLTVTVRPAQQCRSDLVLSVSRLASYVIAAELSCPLLVKEHVGTVQPFQSSRRQPMTNRSVDGDSGASVGSGKEA